VAFAVTVMVPDTVAPLAGEVIETVGGVLLALFTVMDTAALVALFPAESVAIAVKLCVPFVRVVVFSDCEYGEVVSRDPKAVPSTSNCTLAMLLLPDAVAVTVMVPDTVAPLAGEVIETVGGVLALLLTVTTTAVLVPVLPAASCATACRV